MAWPGQGDLLFLGRSRFQHSVVRVLDWPDLAEPGPSRSCLSCPISPIAPVALVTTMIRATRREGQQPQRNAQKRQPLLHVALCFVSDHRFTHPISPMSLRNFQNTPCFLLLPFFLSPRLPVCLSACLPVCLSAYLPISLLRDKTPCLDSSRYCPVQCVSSVRAASLAELSHFSCLEP